MSFARLSSIAWNSWFRNFIQAFVFMMSAFVSEFHACGLAWTKEWPAPAWRPEKGGLPAAREGAGQVIFAFTVHSSFSVGRPVGRPLVLHIQRRTWKIGGGVEKILSP
jgi:hypothetical protein